MKLNPVNRRTFMGGVASALSYAGLNPPLELLAQQTRRDQPQAATRERTEIDYDAAAKLANNENPYGPPESVMKAMNGAWKYANRYNYPDGGIIEAIATHHGVKPENVAIGNGSTEILKMADEAFLAVHKKVVGVDPTYESVYRYATNSKADSIKVPLLKDYRMDIPGVISATKANYRDVGFVYICNPNNPIGNIIPKQEIKMLLESLPSDMPVLIDEAYHHFVDTSDYATSVPYVLEGRPVIVARTFSKIAALAGMRLGYAIAPKDLIERIRPYALTYVNALVKHGAVAALKDKENEARVKRLNTQIRNKTTAELKAFGYESIPSQSNFFMVNAGRDVTPVIEEFRKKNILVGRKFPPMNNWLRVSVGTEQEMTKFMTAFKEIMPAGGPKPAAARSGAE